MGRTVARQAFHLHRQIEQAAHLNIGLILVRDF
jgi:hypothetical protein